MWRRIGAVRAVVSAVFWGLVFNLAAVGASAGETSHLEDFLVVVMNPMYARCKDSRRLMPRCIDCVPGLHGALCEHVDDTVRVRNEIEKLVKLRYPASVPTSKYALYPYLETDEFLTRQREVANRLAADRVRHVVDIGSYYNPIHLFLERADYCPESVVVVEPILEALSVHLPCTGAAAANPKGFTHVLHLPVTFKYYLGIKHLLPHSPDGVVCIGCDSHYGPTRKQLETSWQRPLTLYLEFSCKYAPNAPFNRIQNASGVIVVFEAQRKFSSKEHSQRTTKFVRYE